MSGPIIRKYGFPNFEKIFGERDLKHGAEPDASRPETTSTPETEATEKPTPGSGTANSPSNPAG